MKLYTYWRSSAAYRVRIALNLKGIPYDDAYVHLVKNGGEQLGDAYKQLNPQALVPSLELDNGEILTQSLAIIEYLDETIDGAALLPDEALDRARVRSLAQSIAVDIHPINNLRILKYLVGDLGVSDDDKTGWYKHWIELGFAAFEESLKKSGSNGQFCFGDTPTLADICLIPQVYNANRFNVDMTPYPLISSINENCLKLDVFAKATPEQQGDAVL